MLNADCNVIATTDLDTRLGTATISDGSPVIHAKFRRIGGHEGVGRIVAIGPGCSDNIQSGDLAGIGEFCLAGREQHCIKSTDHLHHEDGSF
jgi:propanol-preferring alcohol dehydrogenase